MLITVQAAVQSNTFVIEGSAEEKKSADIEMLQKLSADLSQAAQQVAAEGPDDDEIPALVEDFEAATTKATDEQ